MSNGTGTGNTETLKNKFPSFDNVKAKIPVGRMAYVVALKGFTEAASIEVDAWSGRGAERKTMILREALNVIAHADLAGTIEPPLPAALSELVQNAAGEHEIPSNQFKYQTYRGPEFSKARVDAGQLLLAAIVDHGMKGNNG